MLGHMRTVPIGVEDAEETALSTYSLVVASVLRVGVPKFIIF